jgi:hypothetical protein
VRRYSDFWLAGGQLSGPIEVEPPVVDHPDVVAAERLSFGEWSRLPRLEQLRIVELYADAGHKVPWRRSAKTRRVAS